MLRRIRERLFLRRREYRVFSADANQSIAGDTASVEVYDMEHPPPDQLRKMYRAQITVVGTWLMFHRLRKGDAVLLVLREQDTLIGFGWIQRWKPLRREFWWLADRAVGLGPYWTHPSHRGRGVYGRLLARSLDECRRRQWDEIYIWAARTNRSSIRGIEKAGFRPLGTHRVSLYLGGLVRRHTCLDDSG